MTLTPCQQLSFEQRVTRYANMIGGAEKRTPGICQICGATLPACYRAVRYTPDPDPDKPGAFERVEAAPGSEQETKSRELAAKGWFAAWQNSGWMVFPVFACGCLDEQVHKAAIALIRKRKEDARAAAEPPQQNANAVKQATRRPASQARPFAALPPPIRREDLSYAD
jgi:hypothetical protein